MQDVQLFTRHNDLTECRADAGKIVLPSLRQAHAAGRAIEQAYAETRFQLPDRLAQRRRRYLQFGRRGSEAAMLRDFPKGHQAVELIEFHILKHNFIWCAGLSYFSALIRRL
ncbi:hypothetical protein D3C85_953090 [compost metagenome]